MQKRFVDEYIKTLNATEAVRRAGYSTKNPNRQASQNLSNPKIQAAIQERFEEAKDTASDRIQDVAETLAQDTSIARGETQVTEFKEVDLLTDEVTIHTRREYVPNLEEQGRARDRLHRVAGAYIERREVEANVKTDKLDNILDQLFGDEDE